MLKTYPGAKMRYPSAKKEKNLHLYGLLNIDFLRVNNPIKASTPPLLPPNQRVCFPTCESLKAMTRKERLGRMVWMDREI